MRLFLAGVLSTLVSISAHAATVTFNYTESFGAVPPDGPAPWATATFVDGGGGFVQLTINVSPTVLEADVTQMYFNLDPGLDPTSLEFRRAGGTGPTAADTTIDTGLDLFRAGGDGFYDILFSFPPHTTTSGTQADRFNAGETLEYVIWAPGLTPSSFNYLSLPGPGAGNPGPYLSAAQFQDTGPGQQGSDWVGAVPIPAAVWLFGSGLLGLIGIARRKKTA